MRKPVKVSGAITPAAAHNNLVDSVNWLLQNAVVCGGPGMETRSLPQGRGIGLSAELTEEGDPSDPIELTFEPTGSAATDTWNRDDDEQAVRIINITGIRYDETTHQLQIKTRTMIYDDKGALHSVSVESDWILIVQFVPHPT
jgi:hypothetical protein